MRENGSENTVEKKSLPKVCVCRGENQGVTGHSGHEYIHEKGVRN